jgi:DNA-binding transcriptional LysR family regulator
MSLNLQHLWAFHAVAADGSISRAARRLQLSQPTLSQQIRTLELRHKVSLFEGRKPPLRLTRAGEDLFALTRRLFAVVQEVETFFDAASDGLAGALRLGSDSPTYAARLAAGFAERTPGGLIKVRIGNADEVVAWLTDGGIDAAISSDPPASSAFHYQPLYRDQLVAAFPIEVASLAPEPCTLSDCASYTLLLREPASRTRRATERMLDAAGVSPRSRIELHTREAIREAISLGLGMSFFYSAECPPDPRIVYRTIADEGAAPTFTGYLICVAEMRRTPTIRTLLALAQDLAGASPLPL